MNYFLMGFGLGVAAGILLAPKSGAETRDLISSTASDSADYVVKQGQQLKDSASDILERGKQAVMSQKDKLAGRMQEAEPAFQR